MKSIIVRDVDIILTLKSKNNIVKNKSIYVKDGVIKAVGEYNELKKKFGSPDEEINGRGKIALPGFYNLHTHVAMAGMRGLAVDKGEVIYKVFWPIERSFDSQIAFDLAMLGALEAAKSGIVLITDHYFFMDSIAKAVSEVGIRGLLGHTYMDWKGPWTGEKEMRKALNFVEKWKEDTLITPVLAPHAPDTVSRENMLFFREISNEKNLFVHFHLAQSLQEYRDIKHRYGTSPVRYVNEIGLLSEKTIAAHCNLIDEIEKRILAHSGTIVAECPSTYLLAGIPFYAFDIWQLGGNVVIGTDAPCYNDNIDFFEEMRLMVYGQRFMHNRDDVWNAWDILEMSTRRAAEVIGFRGGMIGEGYKADIILIRYDKPHMRPLFDPYAAVVYSANMGDVDTVIVDGRIIVRDGKHTILDEKRVLERGERAARELIRRALNESPELSGLLGINNL
ncbi:MAG: hypothetical protein DRJ35_03670 [Thermoprotei archaeon]|nr:MAG: hypothetical protein DRJ35_03670 [Thermoprotei archaeon]